MVPITVLAFMAAQDSILEDVSKNNALSSYDIAGLIIVGIGVFIHNFYPEKSQKASIIDQ